MDFNCVGWQNWNVERKCIEFVCGWKSERWCCSTRNNLFFISSKQPSVVIWFAVVLSSCKKSIRLPLNLISFINVMTKHDYGHLWHVNIWCVMEWILYLRLFQRLMQFHCHFFRYFFHSSLGDTHLFFITDTVASTERFQNTMLTR